MDKLASYLKKIERIESDFFKFKNNKKFFVAIENVRSEIYILKMGNVKI